MSCFAAAGRRRRSFGRDAELLSSFTSSKTTSELRHPLDGLALAEALGIVAGVPGSCNPRKGFGGVDGGGILGASAKLNAVTAAEEEGAPPIESCAESRSV